MIYWMLLAAQVASSSPGITPEQIATLAPKDLGERLLGPTREPIVEAYLYGEALAPPPAPGAPVVTRVVLYEQAHRSGEPQFCEKVRYMVWLHPVLPGEDGKLPPASVDLVTPTTLYRLQSSDGNGPVCEGRGNDFLSVNNQEASGIFYLIRLLAATQNDMRHGSSGAITGSIDDQYARQGFPAEGMSGPITDWRVAFEHFPTTKINRFWRSESAEGHVISFRAAEWTIDLTIPNGRSTFGKATLRRFIPPPA
jgi:hypothetical protein